MQYLLLQTKIDEMFLGRQSMNKSAAFLPVQTLVGNTMGSLTNTFKTWQIFRSRAL
jgi:hypothetical protein